MSKFKLTQTAAEVQDILNNSLQKPTGLAKTKLVGVGVNGQENIEIGDNLTLANGKLSSAAAGGGVNGLQSDAEGNLTASKNLEVDGKLKLKSLVSASNPDGDITKELGGSAMHGYMVIVNDKLHYEVYTTKDYNWTIGAKINISSQLWTNNDYKELRSPGTYPAAGCYKLPSSSESVIVSMIEITDSDLRGNHRYDIKNNQYFSGSISRESACVVKLF